MTNYYKQSEAAPATSEKIKSLPLISLVFKIIAAGLFVTALSIPEYYILFGAFAALAIGITIKQYFYSATREFIYIYSGNSLYFEKKNYLGSEAELAAVPLSNVLTFTTAPKKQQKGLMAAEYGELYILEYVEGGIKRAIYFAPDIYLRSLIKNGLKLALAEEESAGSVFLTEEKAAAPAPELVAEPINVYTPPRSEPLTAQAVLVQAEPELKAEDIAKTNIEDSEDKAVYDSEEEDEGEPPAPLNIELLL